ncbi:MAG: type I restriction enzyme HsdR N-terminal domain-containing protein, partial [SAR324 cluster bacterium]|nr:type I restriction enzyme HsdR N-terminal domain-containing protein [SAR324 cluster bacterium]
MDKKKLTERDICTKFITPALVAAGWDLHHQIREEVTFTAGRVQLRGQLVSRGKSKRADYILYYKPNLPIAVIEAKDNHHSLSSGMQQALDYAHTLDIPFVYASNGDGFVEHDRTRKAGILEQELPLAGFPSPQDLWERYKQWKGLTDDQARIITQDYYFDAGGKAPRYYQRIAINRVIEAVAQNQNRILLVSATGTGKTYIAF